MAEIEIIYGNRFRDVSRMAKEKNFLLQKIEFFIDTMIYCDV